MKYKINYTEGGGAVPASTPVINYKFVDDEEGSANQKLKNVVDLWCSSEDGKKQAIKKYGEINTWDVSKITDMKYLFQGKTSFNDDISSWDVSSVTNMSGMFDNATAFNGFISFSLKSMR